ncbi:hypothetical protein [Amycolatopsis sp. CA-128772]|uniref:hypothetical protein n=1 Tax=Amycolatopsis sp. CA-128772 TaxID=2073159 RepID=UPI000CD29C99|nr:hypothetical protein [Amycolatopsis sp. CA-128772]
MTTTSDDRWFEREQQVRKAHALAEMLTAASEAEIPPMVWTVNAVAGSCLYGEIDDPFDTTPQATFDAWVQFLGLHVNRRGDRAGGACPGHPRIDVGIYNPHHTNASETRASR